MNKQFAVPKNSVLRNLYSRMYGCLEKEIPRQNLTRLLTQTRKSGITRALPIAPNTPCFHFFTRLGWLDREVPENKHKAEKIIADFAGAIERSPAELSVICHIYADGLYGVMPAGICANPPQCKKCALTSYCEFYNTLPLKNKGAKSKSTDKLQKQGKQALSSLEMLALIISSGKESTSARKEAQILLDRYGSLRKLAQASVTELESYAGINRPAALRIAAALALAEKIALEKHSPGPGMRSGKDFFNLFHQRLRDLQQEFFWVVLLNQRNQVIREVQVSQGTLSAALVHPREVFAPAIRDSAAAIALIHNHPSGNPEPSSEDKAVSKRLKDAARILGIRLLDHIIIGENDYVSFVDLELL